MDQPTTLLEAQQAAIQEVRARFERGELSFDDFKRALDALVLAHDPDDCAAVLKALPVASPHAAALAALEPVAPVAPAAPARPMAAIDGPRKRIVAFMAQTHKLRRAWKLQPNTDVTAFMGEVKLNLSAAELPPQARLHITAIMGEVDIYVPSNVQVTVHSRVIMGEANAMGESTAGMIAFGHEDYEPREGAPRATLDIDAFVLMGEVKVLVRDGPAVSIKELVRETIQSALVGMQRGLQTGAAQPALGSSDSPRKQ